MTTGSKINSFYPAESRHLNFIEHLEELRWRVLICLAFFILTSILFFAVGTPLIRILTRPAAGLIRNLVFIAPTEVFASHLRVSFLAGFIVSFPVVLYEGWAFLAPAISAISRRRAALWLTMALACFAGGISFSYFIAVPAALKFLLGFGRGIALPYITLNKYISFVAALILAGGLVFEIPVVMVLLADTGLLKTKFLRKNRPYAFVVIMVAAAVITPTQDIINMLVFALPMIVLYEAGLLLAFMVETTRASTPRPAAKRRGRGAGAR